MTPQDSRRSDFLVSDQRTLLLVHSQSDDALVWLRANTDGTWFAGALVVEPRYVAPLVLGARDQGPVVRGER